MDLPEKPKTPAPIPKREWVPIVPSAMKEQKDQKLSPEMRHQIISTARTPPLGPLDGPSSPPPPISQDSGKGDDTNKPQQDEHKAPESEAKPLENESKPTKAEAKPSDKEEKTSESASNSSPSTLSPAKPPEPPKSVTSAPSTPVSKPSKPSNGCRVKVIIPEFDGTKMALAYPTQTTDEFIKTLLKYPYDCLVAEDLRLLIPMVPQPHTVRGFIMRPDTLMGTYGIGLSSMPVEIPVLILVKKSAEGVYDLSPHEVYLKSQSAGLKIELIPTPWCEVLLDIDTFMNEKRKRLHKLIAEGGIPFCVKGHVWAELAEATDLVRKCPGMFDSLTKIAESKKPVYARKIRVDLCRSMPNHVLFANMDSPGVKSLSRVLYAFGEYEHEIGYCQGLNFIAALLLTIMNEEYAFWTLIQLMRKYQMKHFFTMDVPLLNASLSLFRALLEQELPDIAKHFEAECIPVEAFAAPWFQTIFMGTDFPFNITLRIWDCFMIDGISFIYKVALAILKIGRETILKTNITRLMSVLHFEGGFMSDVDPSYLIDVASKFKFKTEVDPVKVMEMIKEKEEAEMEESQENQ